MPASDDPFGASIAGASPRSRVVTGATVDGALLPQ
jgi:hypothetical protein